MSTNTNGTTPGPVLAIKKPKPVDREMGSKFEIAKKSANGVRPGDTAGVSLVNGSVEDRALGRSKRKGRQAPIKESSSSEDSDAPLVS